MVRENLLINFWGEKKPMGCQWIFTVKYNADSTIERFKTRFIAKDFTQVYGIDYQEIFATCIKLDII